MGGITEQKAKTRRGLVLVIIGLGAAVITFLTLALLSFVLMASTNASIYLSWGAMAFAVVVLWVVGIGLVLAAGLEKRWALGASLFLGIAVGSMPVCLVQTLFLGLAVVE